MNIKFHHDSHQISDSTPVSFLLALAGGFLDAYTYISRGGVFANAQTGNIVLVGIHAAQGQVAKAFVYLIPITAFAAGVFITEIIKSYFKECSKLHWRQIILLIECAILFLTAFFPENLNVAANILISFVCAFQVDSFRKWHGHAFATTMCTGNLRTGTELICTSLLKKDKVLFVRGFVYYAIIITFVAGAAAGCLMTNYFYHKALFFSIVPLAACIFLMCIKERKSK